MYIYIYIHKQKHNVGIKRGLRGDAGSSGTQGHIWDSSRDLVRMLAGSGGGRGGGGGGGQPNGARQSFFNSAWRRRLWQVPEKSEYSVTLRTKVY